MPFFVAIEIRPSSQYEEGGHTLLAAEGEPPPPPPAFSKIYQV